MLLCLGQGAFMAISWAKPQGFFEGFDKDLLMPRTCATISGGIILQTVIITTTGTMLMMWFGEQITERGIGNGVSLVITIGILARLPQAGQGSV